ncbi:MAG: preprotein translocase subunit YajC [Clostridiales bacterium]|nr:preprotein translocase subunit YajC [Clostridiales bacterium]
MFDPKTIFVMSGEGGTGGGFFDPMIIMIIAIFAFLFFGIMRPQSKQRKEREAMISALKEGDDVQTIGGVYGSITKIKQKTVYLRISDKVEIEILKSAIAGKQQGTGE